MAENTHTNSRGWVVEESAFNDNTFAAGFAAANVFDVDRLNLSGALNRTLDPSRRGTPDVYDTRDARPSAEWDLAAAWKPGGVLGTPGKVSPFLRAAFGTRTTPALTMVVAASPTPTTTGCTVDTVTGLAVGDCIVVEVASGARREVTRIKTIASLALTFDALSAAPDVGGDIVSGVNYKLTTAAPSSLAILKQYVENTDQEVVTGALVNDLSIAFSGDEVVMITASGPAARHRTSGATIPGTTSYGAGVAQAAFDGNHYIDGNAFLVRKLNLTFRNGLALRQGELGQRYASGRFRGDVRDVKVDVEYYFEDTDIRTASEAITRTVIRVLAGQTPGQMLGLVIPRVEWEKPKVQSADNGAVMVQASGMVLGTAGNDTIFACEA